MFNTLNLRAALIAGAATLLLVVSILVGSRNLGNFDAALIAYLFGLSLPVSGWFTATVSGCNARPPGGISAADGSYFSGAAPLPMAGN